MLLSINLKAQLPDGSIGPDWVATDIYDVEHRLYDYLDSGKVVIIDFFTTWCSPCWTYHNNGILNEMWELYGPEGTNEVMIFQIETDNASGMNQLLGGPNSQGNWIVGVPFPTINDAPNPNNLPYGTICGDLYEVTYSPTIYVICPSRICNEDHYQDGYMTAAQLHEFMGGCPQATEPIDVALLQHFGNTTYCDNQLDDSKIMIQNLSLNGNLTNATVQVFLDGNVISSTEYTGNLPLYGIDTIALNPMLNLPEQAELTIFINLEGDTFLSNNEIELNVAKAPQSEMSFTIEVQPDNYPDEFSCELLDGAGNLIYGISALSGTGLQTFNVVITDPECITWNIHDSSGDGICCDYGEGYVRLINTSNGEDVMNVTGDYGMGTSKLFLATDGTIGISEHASSEIMIYPNPANEMVYVSANSKIQQIELINHEGRVVKQQNVNSNQVTFNVSDVASGIYGIRITSPNQLTTKKIVIE